MEHVHATTGTSEFRNVEDRVFLELDNRRIGIGPESWIAQVLGVHTADHEGWVQVASQEHPLHSVVVHIWPDTTAGQVALALSKWAELPVEDRPVMIEAPRVDAH